MFSKLMIFTLALATAVTGIFAAAGMLNQPAAPSVLPSPTPTIEPLVFPTDFPTADPTALPTNTEVPTITPFPTQAPEIVVTEEPVVEPEIQPTSVPTNEPVEPRNLGQIVLPMDADYHSQLTETSLPNACGPTSLLMVLDYYGLENSLEEVIAYHMSIPAVEGGYDPSCTANGVCTSPIALVKVAETVYGLSANAHQNWTFEEVQASLQAGQPVIADINWRLIPGNFGHFVVIYGIDAQNNTIFYHDPYDGSNRSASWTQFMAAWNGPIDVGDPVQPEGHRLWGMSLSVR